MTELAKRLNLDSRLVEKLSVLHKNEISAVADKCLDKGFHALKSHSDVMRLAVILECAKRAKTLYDQIEIPESIYYDTMSDIRIWCENNESRGLKNYGWLKNHVKLQLFRIGRLQFQFYESTNKTFIYGKLPFSYGENLINVHIPQGEKLFAEDCRASFLKAEEFFSKFFPNYSYRYYFCESWLLFEDNKKFMKKESNILEFAALFNHAYSVKIDEQAIERIFGKRRLFKRNYPENTSLQKSAKKYMQNGGKMGIGLGTVDRENLKFF